MKSVIAIASLVAAAAAAPDPQITPRAALAPRQNADPALLGYVAATNGQYSDQRSCDYPATLSTSGSLAQCCASASCTFWSSCSAGTLFASSTSLFCDQGFCNTAVLVSTVGASSGPSYLGCWATSLGQNAFTIVRDIGNAGSSATSRAVSSSGSSRATSTGSSASASRITGSATQSSATAATSSGAAAVGVVKPLSGVFGLVAVFFGML